MNGICVPPTGLGINSTTLFFFHKFISNALCKNQQFAAAD
jgi:hypothetical protein